MNFKQTVIDISQAIGFERVVIGSLAPLEDAREKYERWLRRGHAADMEYLKRDPQSRTSPQLTFPQSRCVLILSVSYYSGQPAPLPPGHGRVASYAVGLDYHVVIKAKLRGLKERLAEAIGRPIIGKGFTDDVALYEQAFASQYGLGFAGKNTMIISPGLAGSYKFIAELFLDLELEPDQPYQGTCGKCFRCGDACPTAAISEIEGINSNLCISYLTIENKDEIPLQLRPKLGDWIFGCDICQLVCPYNQRPPETPWPEFRPESGVGNYLDLCDVLAIADQAEFHARFVRSAVRRPKRRGLARNALVVVGNCLRSGDTTFETRQKLESAVVEFASRETDEMLLEHAAWSLVQTPETRAGFDQVYKCLTSAAVRTKVESYA